MSRQSLEERVALLEGEVARLKASLTKGGRPKPWRVVGGLSVANADDIRRAIEIEMEYRAKDREKARRRFARTDRLKKERGAKRAKA